MDKDEIGVKLKQTRMAKGLSVYRISRDTGISEATIRRCELGQGRIETLSKLCKYLQLTLF